MMVLTVRVLCASLALAIAAHAARPMTLFSWHPICTAIAYGLFSEGVMRLKKRKTAVEKESHVLSMSNGMIVLLFAVAVIFFNKNIHAKPHFASWHGMGGAFAALLLTFQAGASLFTYNWPPSDTRVRMMRWRVHRQVGALMHVWLTVLMCTGLNSLWGVQALGSMRFLFMGGYVLAYILARK